MGSEGLYNESTLLFLSELGRWQIAGIVLIALALLLLSAVDLSGLSWPRRLSLLSLRALVIALAIFFALEPSLERRHVSVTPNRVVALVDTSASQALPEGNRRRIEHAGAAVEQLQALLEPQQEAHLLELYSFGRSAESQSLSALDELVSQPAGRGTRILEALQEVAQGAASRELGGVVLISDGSDNGLLSQRTPRGSELDLFTLERLQALGAPVHTVATASPASVRDIAITRVRHDSFAFVRNAVSLRVDVRVVGIDLRTIPLTLYRDGAALQTREIELKPGETDYSLSFEIVPDTIGKEIYTVATPVHPDELIAENNQDHFVLNVIRDKIRALLVVGRPSWDVRALRQLLRANPNVDLISFFILRTPDDVHRAADWELSLIPFPTDELFREQLGSFDVVIFQNFDFGPYDVARYLPLVWGYVRQGGGFLMVGGENSFQSGGYAGTPIADILPVQLPRSTDARQLIDEASFRPQLSEAGLRHPITRLAFDPAQNLETWQSLPAQRGSNVVTGATEDAVVLATHPTRTGADGRPMPVIALRDVGQGRSMAVTFDGAWRWNFEGSSHAGEQPYATFWNNAVRWLIRDPELELISIVLPGSVAEPDEVVEGRIRALEADYSPAAHRSVMLQVFRRDLAVGAGGAPQEVERKIRTTNERGELPFELPAGESGAFTIVATMLDDAGHEHRASEVFLRMPQGPELRDAVPRPELLRAIAQATGGRYFGPGESLSRLDFVPPKAREVDRREVINLWDSPAILFLFVALLVSEWMLRRRWGRL